MTDTRTIAVTVNGSRYDLQVETRLTLVDCLRHHIGLSGTHVGCEHGVCGACTVLFDGQAVRSCLMFAVQADGAVVTTVEGLASENGQLHPLQQAFHDNHGLQCGFCTPGVLMTLLELLQHNPAPTEAVVPVIRELSPRRSMRRVACARTKARLTESPNHERSLVRAAVRAP